MMRQAGRYQKVYRDLALKHPSFRERSENTDLIVEISLQPWNSFKPDGVIIFRWVTQAEPAAMLRPCSLEVRAMRDGV
jgi:uroporphyrinogen decarboxylase